MTLSRNSAISAHAGQFESDRTSVMCVLMFWVMSREGCFLLMRTFFYNYFHYEPRETHNRFVC